MIIVASPIYESPELFAFTLLVKNNTKNHIPLDFIVIIDVNNSQTFFH